MNHLVKKKKNILLGILFIAIIVCTPFLFGEEGCDDGLNEVANSVDENKQNDASGGSGNNLGLTDEEILSLLSLKQNHTIPFRDILKNAKEVYTLAVSSKSNMRTTNVNIKSIEPIKGSVENTVLMEGADQKVLFIQIFNLKPIGNQIVIKLQVYRK